MKFNCKIQTARSSLFQPFELYDQSSGFIARIQIRPLPRVCIDSAEKYTHKTTDSRLSKHACFFFVGALYTYATNQAKKVGRKEVRGEMEKRNAKVR